MQAQIFLTPLSVCALTCCRLGFHFLGEDLWEWLTLCPKDGPFPQISHTFGIFVSLFSDSVKIYTTKPALRSNLRGFPKDAFQV